MKSQQDLYWETQANKALNLGDAILDTQPDLVIGQTLKANIINGG